MIVEETAYTWPASRYTDKQKVETFQLKHSQRTVSREKGKKKLMKQCHRQKRYWDPPASQCISCFVRAGYKWFSFSAADCERGTRAYPPIV